MAVSVTDLGKCFHIYEKPKHRLLQMLYRGRKQFYKEFWALKDISFSIKRGESLGIIGLNGSGKSTLLQIICGTLHPTMGKIAIQGRIAALLELGSGFNMEFTGIENIFLYAALFGLSQKEIQSRLATIEEFADIGDFIHRPVKTYSSGMVVRLAFSVIANIDAEILVIDEALSVGDAFFQQKCMRFLREFRQKGTLIFVSHDSGAVINLCDRALWLNKGNLLMDASPKDVADAYLANLYELQQGASDSGFRKKLDGVSNSDIGMSSSQLDNVPHSFGKGDAKIQNVILTDEHQNIVTKVHGGEKVCLRIAAYITNDIQQPIVGFQIKDRLGQVIFGTNTYHSYKESLMAVRKNEQISAEFTFIMPTLLRGTYSVQVAIASGTLVNHVQLHWIYDALLIEVIPVNNQSLYFDGLIYIPILKMELKQELLPESIL